MSKQKSTHTDLQIEQMVKHSAHQIWLAGLGAFVQAQQDKSNLFDTLVQQGKAAEAHDCTEHAAKAPSLQHRTSTPATAPAATSWSRMDGCFEERIARTLKQLGVPSRQEVQSLSDKIDVLSRSLQQLSSPPAKQ